MATVRFEIQCEDIKNSLEYIYYSYTKTFHLKKYEDGKKVFDGNVTLEKIENGRSKLPVTDYDAVSDEFFDYIDKHNQHIANDTFDIRFEITDMDSRGACKYKEYMGDKLIKEGRGWGKDIKNEQEYDAWVKGVVEYNKKNGIKMPTDLMSEAIDKIMEAIDKLDSELPDNLDLTPPTLELALPTITTNPCECIENIMKAAQIAMVTIGGLPDIKDLATYYMTLGKHNVVAAIKNAACIQKPIVKSAVVPLTEPIRDLSDYYAELDAMGREFRKQHAEEIVSFDLIEREEIKFQEIIYEEVSSESSYNEPSRSIMSYSGTRQGGQSIRTTVAYILSVEGGFVNDKDDSGGATNKGVTIGTFRTFFGKDKTVDDLKKITDEQWTTIFRKGFWDYWQCDMIKDFSVVNVIINWAYMSGNGNSALRRALGINYKGKIQQKTIDYINSHDGEQLFRHIWNEWVNFLKYISKEGTKNYKFRKGWMNRTNEVQYGSLILHTTRERITF